MDIETATKLIDSMFGNREALIELLQEIYNQGYEDGVVSA